jgi:hypothetical protein
MILFASEGDILFFVSMLLSSFADLLFLLQFLTLFLLFLDYPCLPVTDLPYTLVDFFS